MKKLQLLALSMLLSPAVITFAAEQGQHKMGSVNESAAQAGTSHDDRDADRDARRSELQDSVKDMVSEYKAFASEDDRVEAKAEHFYTTVGNQMADVKKEMSETKRASSSENQNHDRIANLQDELKDLQRNLKNAESHFQSRIQNLENCSSKLQCQVDEENKTVSDIKNDKDFNANSERGSFLQDRFNDLTNCIQEKSKALKTLQSKCDAAKKAWNDLQSQFAEKQATFGQTKSSKSSSETTVVKSSTQSKSSESQSSSTPSSSSDSSMVSSSTNDGQKSSK